MVNPRASRAVSLFPLFGTCPQIPGVRLAYFASDMTIMPCVNRRKRFLLTKIAVVIIVDRAVTLRTVLEAPPSKTLLSSRFVKPATPCSVDVSALLTYRLYWPKFGARCRIVQSGKNHEH